MPAPPRDPQRTIDSVVDVIFEIAGQPVRACAEFYALYYLAELEYDRAARQEFPFRRSRIRDGLYWYTVFALLSELSTADEHYMFEGADIGGFVEEGGEEGARQIREHAAALATELDEDFPGVDVDPDRLTDRFETMLSEVWQLHAARGSSPGGVSGLFRRAEGLFGVVTDPQVFVGDVELFFRVTESPALSPSEFATERATGWLPLYQGEAWEAIAVHAQRLAEEALPETSWVDQTWAIEHNNSNFMDKINYTFDERRDLATIRGSIFGEDTGPDFTDAVVQKFLIDLLDATRESDMELVFTYAAAFETETKIDFAAKAHQYDIHILTSDPVPVTFTDVEHDTLSALGRVIRSFGVLGFNDFSDDEYADAQTFISQSPSQEQIRGVAELVDVISDGIDPAIGRVTVDRTEAQWRSYRGVIEWGYRMASDDSVRAALRDVGTIPLSLRQIDVLRQLDGKLTQAVGMRT